MRTYIILLLVTWARFFSGFSEGHWRWRKDNGSETNAAWRASQDFPGTIMDRAGIRLRVEVYNGLGKNEAGTAGLQYERGPGPWVTVSDSVRGHDFVIAGSSPFVRDGQVTTMQVNDPGGGTFEGGRVLVKTYRFADTIDAGARKEYEWDIRATGSYSPDSLYRFRMTYTGSPDAISYLSPVPGMMIRTAPMMIRGAAPVPDNDGIYRDSSVTNFFNRDSGWVASDGCMSIPLSDGRVLWTMGDSYIGRYDTRGGTMPCLFQVRNSVLVQPFNDWYWPNTATLIGHSAGVPSYLKNNSDDKYLLWPTSGYQRGDTLYIYCMNIMNSEGGLGFASGGNDFLAKIVFPSLDVTGFKSLPNFNGINWGLGFDTTERGDYIYTWGVKGTGFIESNIYVARFPRRIPGEQWSFWNGSGWDRVVSHAAVIAHGASNGIFVAKVRNKYVLVSTAFSIGCDGGAQIFSSTGDSLMGPFSPRKSLYTIPDNVLGHTPFFYSPVVHPEYINVHNEILLTYDINGYGPCEPFCINNGANPDYYRPRGIRVPLALIDSAISDSPTCVTGN